MCKPLGFGPRTCALKALTGMMLLLAWSASSHAQGPQFDIEGPPGAPNARGKLGPTLGASGTSGFALQSAQPVSGKVGVSGSRAPINALNPPPVPTIQPTKFNVAPVQSSISAKTFTSIDMPPSPEQVVGLPNGLTLDQAIEFLVSQNLGLVALRYEIPMAQADIITAGLRANPVFYADTQLIPYGNYSNARPGGPVQSDVNVNYPVDINQKRKYRKLVYTAAKKSTEAQLQDAVRNTIDNLYTVYVDVVQATQNLNYANLYLRGMTRLQEIVNEKYEAKVVGKQELDLVRVSLGQAQIQVREGQQAYDRALHNLGLLLNIDQYRNLHVRSLFYDKRPIEQSDRDLLSIAFSARPDLAAQKFGLDRAEAEIRSAKAERFSDVYVVYQPYTFQNNNYLGLKSAYSWTLGVTAVMPIYNRNQGNIQRAKLNSEQTRVELAGQEKQVAFDVLEAIREYNLSLESMIELNDKVLRDAREILNLAFKNFNEGRTSLDNYLDAQKDYNDLAKSLSDAIIRHRRAMLDLNTAVGVRVMP